MAHEITVDFGLERDMSRLQALLRHCKGKNRVTVIKYRERRTNPQNAYYWACIVSSLVKYLADQGESYTDEEVHHLFGAKFLRKSLVNPANGELIGETIRSTTELSIEEFAVFLDQCIVWLADMFDVVVPDPERSMSFA